MVSNLYAVVYTRNLSFVPEISLFVPGVLNGKNECATKE